MAKRILSILVWIWIHRRSILGDLGEKICSCIIIVLLFDFFASKRCYLSFLWGFNPLLRPKAPLGPPYGLILLDICIYLAANEVQILFVNLFFLGSNPVGDNDHRIGRISLNAAASSEALLACSETLPTGSKALPAGSVSLPAGSEALSAGSKAPSHFR